MTGPAPASDRRQGASEVFQDLRQHRNPPGIRGRNAVTVQLWWIVQAVLFNATPQAMYGWRRWLLRRFGAKIGQDVLLRPSVKVTYPWKLTIGDNCLIGDDVRLYNLDQIIIGSDCVVSQSSYLCTGSHDHTTPGFDLVTAPITLEDQCWIAADCFVMPGMTVGRGAVVSARSMVTRPVAAADIVAGTPARPVGKRRPA